MFAIGLTGGIGSGKSLVADLFAQHGAAIVDTDAIAHALTHAGGAAIAPIRAAFGGRFIDRAGALDRAQMRQHVFAQPAERARLEAILHPLIRAAAEAQAGAAMSAPYVVYAVPLLVESKSWASRVDRVLVVDCPVETQIARVVATRGLPRAQVEAIVAQQASRQVRLDAADDIIENAGAAADVPPRVARLHARYAAAAGAHAPL